jgi:hypothetical protein
MSIRSLARSHAQEHKRRILRVVGIFRYFKATLKGQVRLQSSFSLEANCGTDNASVDKGYLDLCKIAKALTALNREREVGMATGIPRLPAGLGSEEAPGAWRV